MACTYGFEEDAANGRWRWVQNEDGVFTEGKWYAKGEASLEVDEATGTVEIKILGDEPNLDIPLSYITSPTAGTAEAIFDALRVIIY